MKNPFENLRIDTRNMLPGQWYDYPVLTEYETIHVHSDGRRHADLRVGIQDGFWTCGISYELTYGGGGFNPDRKWGQFNSKEEAVLWGLGKLLASKLSPKEKSVKEKNTA